MEEKLLKDIIQLSEQIKLNPKKQTIENIIHIHDFEVGGSGLAINDVNIVEISNERERKTGNKSIGKQKNELAEDIDGLEKYRTYQIYDKDNNLIATVNEQGKILFEKTYIEQLKQIDSKNFEQLNLEDIDFELPEKLEKNNLVMGKEELEKRKLDEKLNKISDTIGSNKINSYSEIGTDQTPTFENLTNKQELDPNVKVTQTETLADMIPEIKQKDIVKIGVVYSDYGKGQNGRFSFVGITKDGNIDSIDSLENTEGATTGQRVTSINSRDGKLVEQEQVAGMVRINGRNSARGMEEMLSVRVGQYGILEIDYVRAELSKNKEERYISAPLETQNQLPTTREVREFMDKTKNVDMRDELERANSEIEYNEETQIKNIDDTVSNDELAPDDIIILSDGTKTTLRKEALKAKISPEEFARRYNARSEKTPDEKIDNIHDEVEEEFGSPQEI